MAAYVQGGGDLSCIYAPTISRCLDQSGDGKTCTACLLSLSADITLLLLTAKRLSTLYLESYFRVEYRLRLGKVGSRS